MPKRRRSSDVRLAERKRIDSWPTVAAILLSTLAVPYAAHAWGREGHVIVAEVAAMHLTPQARLGVHRLLDLEPDPKHRTLAHAAIWPDLIKNPRHPQHKQYAFARKLRDEKMGKTTMR